jgi:glutaminyl-tRNA synthetase
LNRPTPKQAENPGNFVRELVEADLAEGRHGKCVRTRFPPEPNGYLHIGHAKSICLNFGLAELTTDRHCNLRFDDTNPSAEEAEYVHAIKEDVRWLGFDWGAREFYASDYFEQLCAWAELLIQNGKAYVDSQSAEDVRQGRGNFYQPGVNSPYRERSIAENLDLFRRMRAGEFEEGTHLLRAKIDMTSANVNLRDPPIYRILKAPHHRTGSAWKIYPMYDYAHGLSDALEGITHSVCTLEFENHRPLYDWFLDQLPVPARPQQIEFARLNLTYTVLSKRKLQELVRSGHVSGWDDPRLPTLAGLRRRGYTSDAIRTFCERIGVAKREGVVDVALLEYVLREDLNARAPRVMAVLRPLKLIIDNFDEGASLEVTSPNHPEYPERGVRTLQLSRELYIERDDFMENPSKQWHRLAPGREVRLRSACLVTCTEVVKDEAGQIVELHATWDPKSLGGLVPDGRKVKGTLHWVSARHSQPATVRMYDRLFSVPNPGDDLPEGQSFLTQVNPHSLEVLTAARVEESIARATPGEPLQFERLGYFCVDSKDSRPDALVINSTISLRDSWAKIAEGGG